MQPGNNPYQPVNVPADNINMALSLGRTEGLVIGIGHDIKGIKTENEKQWDEMKETKTKVEGLESDLRNHITIEETTEKVKQKFYEKHPVKTVLGGLTIGGVSLTTIIGGIILLIFELKEKHLIP